MHTRRVSTPSLVMYVYRERHEHTNAETERLLAKNRNSDIDRRSKPSKKKRLPRKLEKVLDSIKFIADHMKEEDEDEQVKSCLSSSSSTNYSHAVLARHASYLIQIDIGLHKLPHINQGSAFHL